MSPRLVLDNAANRAIGMINRTDFIYDAFFLDSLHLLLLLLLFVSFLLSPIYFIYRSHLVSLFTNKTDFSKIVYIFQILKGDLMLYGTALSKLINPTFLTRFFTTSKFCFKK